MHMLLRVTIDGRERRAACGRTRSPSGILCEAPPGTPTETLYSDGVTCKACLKVLGPPLIDKRRDDVDALRDRIDRLADRWQRARVLLARAVAPTPDVALAYDIVDLLAEKEP